MCVTGPDVATSSHNVADVPPVLAAPFYETLTPASDQVLPPEQRLLRRMRCVIHTLHFVGRSCIVVALCEVGIGGSIYSYFTNVHYGSWWSVVATALCGLWATSDSVRLTTVFISSVVGVVTALVGAFEDYSGHVLIKSITACAGSTRNNVPVGSASQSTASDSLPTTLSFWGRRSGTLSPEKKTRFCCSLRANWRACDPNCRLPPTWCPTHRTHISSCHHRHHHRARLLHGGELRGGGVRQGHLRHGRVLLHQRGRARRRTLQLLRRFLPLRQVRCEGKQKWPFSLIPTAMVTLTPSFSDLS